MRTILGIGGMLALACLWGCGRTRVTSKDGAPTYYAESVADPAALPATDQKAKPDAAAGVWHRVFQVSENASESEIQRARETAALLAAKVKRGILEHRESANWTVISMNLGDSEGTGVLTLMVNLGREKLFERHAEINIAGEPLETALRKLARQAGIRYAQDVMDNPRMSWSGQNVSAYDAIMGVLEQTRFRPQWWATNERIFVRPSDFPSEQAFIEEAIKRAVNMGDKLNGSLPAMVVSNVPKPGYVPGYVFQYRVEDPLDKKPGRILWTSELVESNPLPAAPAMPVEPDVPAVPPSTKPAVPPPAKKEGLQRPAEPEAEKATEKPSAPEPTGDTAPEALEPTEPPPAPPPPPPPAPSSGTPGNTEGDFETPILPVLPEQQE
jgi:hypothetical protein